MLNLPRFLSLALVASGATAFGLAAEAQDKKPNILFLSLIHI